MLTTDRGKLVTLVSSLRIEIDIFLASIRLQSHPNGNDEAARSRFLRELLDFLKQATDMSGETVRSHLLFSDTPLAAVPPRSLSVPPPGPSQVNTAQERLRHTRSTNFTPRPGSSRGTPFPSTPRPRSRGAPFPSASRPGSRATSFPPYPRIPRFTPPLADHHHSLWFCNAPPEARPPLVAEQIYGAPLESLKWYRHYNDPGFSFLINFFTHAAALRYLAWANSDACTMTFPGLGLDWRPEITWSENPNGVKRYVLKAAYDGANPARRVLLFRNYPVRVGRVEFRGKLEELEDRCRHTVYVDRFTIWESGQAELVVGKIETAMMIVEWLERGWLGVEFEGCEVEFGRDLSDRPFPVDTRPARSLLAPSPLPPRPPRPPQVIAGPAPLLVSAPAPYRLIDVPDWISPRSRSPSVAPSPSPAPSPPSSPALMIFPEDEPEPPAPMTSPRSVPKEVPESPASTPVLQADDFSDKFFEEWRDSVF